MSLPDAKTQMLKVIELIEKLDLPFDPTFAWCILESMTNSLFLRLASIISEEKLCEFVKEWSAASGLPVTDAQLETYKQRLKQAQELFKPPQPRIAGEEHVEM